MNKWRFFHPLVMRKVYIRSIAKNLIRPFLIRYVGSKIFFQIVNDDLISEFQKIVIIVKVLSFNYLDHTL